MKFTELVDSGESKTKRHEFLIDSKQMAITVHIPSNLENAAAEAVNLKGLSFSASCRMCMTDELVKEDK